MLTKEQRDKKNWLNSYRTLLYILDCKLIERNDWRDRVINISPSYSDTPKSQGCMDKIGEGIAIIKDIDGSLNEEIKNIKQRREEIKNAIDNVSNTLYKAILTMRYINGKKWEEIVYLCNYGWTHTHRLHEEALDCIEIKKME